jgi:hypothetical protein
MFIPAMFGGHAGHPAEFLCTLDVVSGWCLRKSICLFQSSHQIYVDLNRFSITGFMERHQNDEIVSRGSE